VRVSAQGRNNRRRYMADRQDTIAAIATPPGNGGIGIVRLSGSNSLRIAGEITRAEVMPRQTYVRTFHDQQNRIIDRGILIYFKSPHSFTGEDVIEFHAHGGRIVLGLLLQEALDRGARLARPGEFSERAYLNDRIDLIQAEAIADLIESQSAQAARSAARSLEGEFSASINRIIDSLISLRVFIEGALDFPEEEIDFLAGSDVQERLTQIGAMLGTLSSRATAGRKLAAGLRVAIIGRPNVGKSSLLNRLVQASRAIVTEIPGTTRDTIEDTFLVKGMPVTLVDTAGIRDSADPVEQEGIRRSRDEMIKADVILLMGDTNTAGIDESGLMPELEQTGKMIILHNKIDLYAGQPGSQKIDGIRHIHISALTGAGMEMLIEALAEITGVSGDFEDVVLARQRHINALHAAQAAIAAGAAAYKSSGSAELLAEELRNAQQLLGGITGQFHNDDLLGEIFSRFCIGK